MELLKIFKDWKDVVEFDAHTVIFPEGKKADVLYVIISGEVELTLRGEPLGTEGVGSLIGEMAITHSATRSTTATALTDVRLSRLTRYQLSMLMTKSPDLSLHIITMLANRLRAVNNNLTVQLDSVQ